MKWACLAVAMVMVAACRHDGEPPWPTGSGFDPHRECAPDDPLVPLRPIAVATSFHSFGACGHVAYERSEEDWTLTDPGGVPVAQLGRADFVRFSPNGRLAVAEQTDRLALHDVYGGSETSVPRIGDYGFVPHPLDPVGTVLWVCGDGQLTKVDMQGSVPVSGEVDCDSVTEATAAPVVAYFDLSHQLYVADFEHERVVRANFNDAPIHAADNIRHWLRISPDGELVRYEADEVHEGSHHTSVTAVLQRLIRLPSGEVIMPESDYGIETLFAEGTGHTIMFRAHEAQFIYVEHQLIELPSADDYVYMGQHRVALLHESGTLEIHDLATGDVLMEELGGGPSFPVASPLGGALMVVTANHEEEKPVVALRIWSEAHGLSDPALVGRVIRPYAALEDGAGLVTGFEGEEVRVFIVAASGSVLAEWKPGDEGTLIPQLDSVQKHIIANTGSSVVAVSRSGGHEELVEAKFPFARVDARRERILISAAGQLHLGAVE